MNIVYVQGLQIPTGRVGDVRAKPLLQVVLDCLVQQPHEFADYTMLLTDARFVVTEYSLGILSFKFFVGNQLLLTGQVKTDRGGELHLTIDDSVPYSSQFPEFIADEILQSIEAAILQPK